MNEKESQAALMSALTTEHLVLQAAASATVSDAAARSSLYVISLSSSLVAIGFASRSREVFVPFMATVLPSVFVLGLFTIVRLVDSALENLQCLAGIARIRGYYRTLTPDASVYFAARYGRWPEGQVEGLRLGLLVAFLSTSATMIAFIDSVVAGIGVMLLARRPLLGPRTVVESLLGITVAAVLMIAFLSYQRWRFHAYERTEKEGDPAQGDRRVP
jgi:hypothetical protein